MLFSRIIKPKTAGAAPNATASASESRCFPKSPFLFNILAAIPSSLSETAEARIRMAAMEGFPCTDEKMESIARMTLKRVIRSGILMSFRIFISVDPQDSAPGKDPFPFLNLNPGPLRHYQDALGAKVY